MSERISIIGAGSAQFSMGIVRDLSLTAGLQGSEVVFMDVDEERLSIVKNLADRFSNEVGSSLSFQTTIKRENAIKDSGFVINTALAGSHQLMENEREVQEKQGYYHGIAVHAPYRQLKLMHNIANDVERFGSKNAYILQSANPLPEGCTIMTRETGVDVIGLCHGHLEFEKILERLEIPKKGVIYEASGINHCIWMTKLQVGGKNIYPEIDRWIDEQSQNYWNNWNPEVEEMQMSPAAIDLYKMYGLMPIGDTCRASWPEAWWYHTNNETEKKWWGWHGGYDGEEGWKLHLKWLDDRQKQIVSTYMDKDRPVTDVFPPELSREQIVPIIDSISNNKPAEYQVNIPNKGMIGSLPNDFVVEIPVTIDGSGIHTKPINALPDSVMLGVLVPRWLFAERIIAAYKSGDKRFLLQAYLSDHKTSTREQAEATIDKIIIMKGNEEMRKKFSN
jgi:alpha-galactosidase